MYLISILNNFDKNMKLENFIPATLLALSSLFFSCSGGGDLINQELTISDTEISSIVAGGTHTITLESPSSWSASKSKAWIHITPNSGQKGTHNIEIRVDPNNEGKARVANVTFKAAEQSKKLSIRQEWSYYFELPCDKYVIDYTGGKILIFGLPENDYTITIDKDVDWLNAEGNALEVDCNNSDSMRHTTVEITDHLNGITYNVHILQRSASSDPDGIPTLTSLIIDGYNCPSDSYTPASDFLYSVSQSETKERATIEFSGESIEWITIEGIEENIFSGDEISLDVFHAGANLKIQSHHSGTENIGESILNVSCLPIVTITTSEAIKDEPKVDCVFTLFDPEARTDAGEEKNLVYFESQAGIEHRGMMAQRFKKKPFNFKLYDDNHNKREAQLLNIRNDNSWILDAMYLDPARMRDRVCFDIWNSFNRPYYVGEKPKAMSGTRGYYVEVFINGEYQGLYTLTDRIDRKQYQIEKEGGYIYKAKGWGTACRMYSCKKPNNDDYLWNSAEIEQTYPDADDGQKPYFNFLADLISFVGSSSKEDFSAKFEEYFDIHSVVDAFIFINMVVADDNLGKNTYWILRNVNESKKFIHGLWDLNGSLGRNWNRREEDPAQDLLIYGDENVSGKIWPFRLYERIIEENPANIHQKIYDRWNELKNTAFTPNTFNAIVDSYADLQVVSGAHDREVARWLAIDQDDYLKLNRLYHNVYYDDIDAEVQYMKQWWARRHSNLNSLITYTLTHN